MKALSIIATAALVASLSAGARAELNCQAVNPLHTTCNVTPDLTGIYSPAHPGPSSISYLVDATAIVQNIWNRGTAEVTLYFDGVACNHARREVRPSEPSVTTVCTAILERGRTYKLDAVSSNTRATASGVNVQMQTVGIVP